MEALASNNKKKSFIQIQAPNIPLQPTLIILRSIWLNAYFYFCEHFQTVKFVLSSFDTEKLAQLSSPEIAFKDDEIKGKLAYIKTNFVFLPSSKRFLERGITLEYCIALVKNVEDN